MRNLKILGLSLVAMMALGATMASGAFAAAEFHSDSRTGNTIITGTSTGDHVFDAAGSTITCTGATFSGTQTGNTATEVISTAAYSGCTVSILGFKIGATVNMNNCAYTFDANGTVAVVDNGASSCASSPITYRVSNFLGECDVKVGPQGGLSKATYDGTTTESKDIVVTPNVTGISGSATGGLCPEAGNFSNGNYTSGPTTVRGFVDNAGKEEEETAIWVTHS